MKLIQDILKKIGSSIQPCTPGDGFDSLTLGQNTPAAANFGKASHYAQFNTSGQQALIGDARYWISVAPFLDENSANVANKPTLVSRGIFGGYSLPEYAADEELRYRLRVPHAWDAITNPWFVAITSISAVEDVDDNYKFQLEWQSKDILHVIPDTIAETLTDEVTVADGTAFYAEIIAFELDATSILRGQNLQTRLRRIAATAPSVDNEIIVWHWDTRWKVSRPGTVSIQGY